MKIADIDMWVRGVDKNIIMVFGIILNILIGWLGYSVGNEFSLVVFYVVPVMLVAWYAEFINIIVITVISALTWLIGDRIAANVYVSVIIPYINALTRFLLYMVMASLVYIIRKQLYRETKFANEDFLTKISNSRAFFNYAGMEIQRLKRYKEPFTLAYFDVDNFKAVNDNYGHNAGNTLLVQLARTIRKNIRPTDVVARMGGDEFAILLLETKPKQARIILGKLQGIMKEVMQKNGKNITFSFGVVTFLKPPRSLDDMVKKADDMMYLSKREGKDAINYFIYQ